MNRRNFLKLSGSGVGARQIGAAAVDDDPITDQIPKATRQTSSRRVAPQANSFTNPPIYGDPKAIRPHILAWGGENPFTGGNGFDEVPPDRLFETILSTHADKNWWKRLTGFSGPPSATFGIGPPERAGIEFGLDHGLGSMLGRSSPIHLDDPIEERWYNQLPDTQKWRWPDGSLIKSLDEAAVRRIDGETIGFGARPVGHAGDPRRPIPSKHIPGAIDLFAQTAIDSVSVGTDGHMIDGGTNFTIRDFSTWAKAAFREHLATLSQSRLDELGIEDPESLDVVEEILDRTPLNSGDHPATDPLYREYIKQDYRTLRDFFQQVREAMANPDDIDPEQLVLFANQLAFLDAPELLAITAEPLTFPCGESQHSVPPTDIYDFNIKLGVAAGRFEKSAFNMGTHVTRKDPEQSIAESSLDVSTVQPDLLSVDFAEQIANRGIGAINVAGDQSEGVGDAEMGTIHTQPSNWFRADGTMPEKLQDLTGFAWSAKELFRGGTFRHDVAVVLSIPTLMWARAEPWGYSNDDVIDSFTGAASIVREAQHPYDVLFFGHPDLWDDSDMLDRLSTYDQVVLPSIRSLSAAQQDQLREALDSGLHLIITDDSPKRTADYEPLADSHRERLLDHANTTVLNGSPAREYWNGNGDGSDLRDALNLQPPQITTNSDAPVGITVQTQTEPERVVLQIVNYDFDLDDGTINPLSELDLTLRDAFDTDISAAKLYRPHEQPKEIQPTTDGEGIQITVPAVSAWATIVLGSSGDAVSLPGDRTSAKQTIQTAESMISSAEADGRSDGLEHARRFRDRAETALEYGAFEKAETEAERAKNWADRATPVPTIGIDVGHNQPEASGGSIIDDFEQFRNAFIRDVEFTRVPEWTEDTLAELDVLIVPPAFKSQDVPPFEFTNAEARLLGKYVDRGGGVLFLARSGIALDHSVVLDQFDIGFEPGTVQWPEGSDMMVERGDIHRVNQTILNLIDAGSGAVVNTSEESQVLVQYPHDTDAWRDVCGGPDRQECDREVAGEPFSTITNAGAGTVIAYGRFNHLKPPDWLTDWELPFSDRITLLRNSVRFLAQQSLGQKLSTTPTLTTQSATETARTNSVTDGKSTTPTEISPDTTRTSGQLGFGFLPALLGFGSLVALYRWCSDDQ